MWSQQSHRSATRAVAAGFFLDMEQYFTQIPHDLAPFTTTSSDSGEIAFNNPRQCGCVAVMFSGKCLHFSKAILSINSRCFSTSFTYGYQYHEHFAHATLDLSNDDNPAALEAMFKCMYTQRVSSFYTVADPDVDSTSSCYLKRLSIIIAIFLIADKYDVESVRDICLHQFSAEYRAAKSSPMAQKTEDFIAAARFLCESADMKCIADKGLHMLFVHICAVDYLVIGLCATYQDFLIDFPSFSAQVVEEHQNLNRRLPMHADPSTSAGLNALAFHQPRIYCIKCGNHHY